jgi:hypothetical protein
MIRFAAYADPRIFYADKAGKNVNIRPGCEWRVAERHYFFGIFLRSRKATRTDDLGFAFGHTDFSTRPTSQD